MTLAELGVNSLAIYPEIGLVIFFAVFAAVTVRVLRRPQSEMDDCAGMPLDETSMSVDDTSKEPRGVS